MDLLYKVDTIELLEVSIRCLISLVALFFVTKMLGKKQVSQLSLFDYVIGISIGNFAAEISVDLNTPFLNGVISIIIFGLVAYAVSILTMKSMRLRRFIIGTPTIIIQNGKILENNLKKVKLDINDMLEECRTSGYFDISQIEFALMEANGKLSILAKGDYQQLTIKDMNLKPEPQGLCANIVIDGEIMENNLKNYGKNKKWLLNQLKIKGTNLNDVLLATLDINEKLMVYERNKNEENINVLE